MRNIYQDYTFYLTEKIRNSPISGTPIKQKTASYLQSSARFFICSCLQISDIEVKNFAPFIAQIYSSDNEAVEKETLQTNFEVNRTIFETIAKHLMNKQDFPIKIQLEKFNLKNLILYGKTQLAFSLQENISTKCIKQFHFLSYSELDTFLIIHNYAKKSSILNQYNRIKEQFIKSNEEFHRERLYLANIASHAFLNIFFANTGLNLETALNIKNSQINPKPSRKGYRTIIDTNINDESSITLNNLLKRRAQNKSFDIEITLKFKSLFFDFLNFREWFCNSYSENDYLFVYPAVMNRSDSTYQVNSISNSSIESYRKWLIKFIPTLEWITSTQYRKTKSLIVSQISGNDLRLTAKIMGNEVNTIKKFYTEYNTKEYLNEMDTVITKIRDSALKRAGFDMFEPANIDKKLENSQEIITGHCNNNIQSPLYLSGATQTTPIPNCKQFENCLFCQHYTLHSDQKDIRKLLSLKWWLTENSGLNINYHYLILNRIEDILKELVAINISFKSEIEKIQIEVDAGKFSDFWDYRLSTIYSVYEEL